MDYNEDDYVLGVWQSCNEDSDFLLQVKRANSENEWKGEYRFRYHAKDDSGDVFNSNDKKSVCSITWKATEEDALLKMHEFFKHIQILYPHNAKFIDVRGDIKKLVYLLRENPGSYIKAQNKDGDEISVSEAMKDV